MNVIVIVLDSFRQDHVGTYHRGRAPFPEISACKTPNLDSFAEKCVVFENVYPEALPTIPIRCQLMTGQQTLPFRSWQPLLQQDVTMAEILRQNGYVCGLISDTYHYRGPGQNYHRGFNAYRWVRGQEYDPYESAPTRRDLNAYVNENYSGAWKGRIAQFLANTDDFKTEEDWFPAKVVDEAVTWLRKNRAHQKVFLWIDSFDPHEPWDPPARFDTYRDPDYRGPRLIMPMGGMAEQWATPEQIRQIQGLYAGEAAFVDHCLGRLFQAIAEYGYLDDSLIVLLADHGHPLADHGKFLKGADRMYNELLKVPFFFYLPDQTHAGQRTDALIQFHDVLPTILDLLGLGNNTAAMHGRSFRRVLERETEVHRAAIITGFHEGADRCIRDYEWSLILRPKGEPNELYHLVSDPAERRNVITEHPDVAQRLADSFGRSFFPRSRSSVETGIQGKHEISSASVE